MISSSYFLVSNDIKVFLYRKFTKIYFLGLITLISFYHSPFPIFLHTKLNKSISTHSNLNITYTFSSRIIEETWTFHESQKSQGSPTCVPKLAAIMWVRSLAANMEYLAQKIWERTARQRPVRTQKSSCGFTIHEQTAASWKPLRQLST